MGVDDYRRKCGRDRGRAISYLHFADQRQIKNLFFRCLFPKSFYGGERFGCRFSLSSKTVLMK